MLLSLHDRIWVSSNSLSSSPEPKVYHKYYTHVTTEKLFNFGLNIFKVFRGLKKTVCRAFSESNTLRPLLDDMARVDRISKGAVLGR